MKTILLALMFALALPVTTFADVDCSDVKSKNRDECVRAKNNDNGNNRGGNINCNEVKNKNRDDCIRAKRDNDNNDFDFDKDDVNCRNADDPEVRRACLRRKY
jgi:hypothetical protein